VRIDVGGVNEIAAMRMRVVDDEPGFGQIRLVCKHHAAQAQAGHFERAFSEVFILHHHQRTG
jgi:hypothetical protein